MSQLIIEAVRQQAKADEAKAIANLNNYMTNPVAVGEHPDLVAEVAKLLKDISDAREMAQVIDSLTAPENTNEETTSEA